MANFRRMTLLLLLLAGTLACASGRGGSAIYRRDVGTATLNDALTIGHQIIGRYGYEVQEVDTTRQIRVLTHWKERRPFADELELGIDDAETRMVITGRPRSINQLGSFYALNVTIENRVRTPAEPNWNESRNTVMFRAWADELANEYKRLITNIGVRRYD